MTLKQALHRLAHAVGFVNEYSDTWVEDKRVFTGNRCEICGEVSGKRRCPFGQLLLDTENDMTSGDPVARARKGSGDGR